MDNQVFNTVFETSLRVILLLREKSSLTSGQIACADFIATFARYFETTDVNLNGDGRLQLRGFSVRRRLVQSAIRKLVVKGFLAPVFDGKNFLYKLTDQGVKFSEELKVDYAMNYRNAVKYILQRWPDLKESELSDMINNQQRILNYKDLDDER